MAIYNSRQSGIVFISQRMVSFYHDTIPQDADTYFFYQTQEADQKPKYTLSLSSFANKNRCLQYKNFNAYAYEETVCTCALYIDPLGGCSVLFETNFIQCQQNQGSVMGTFWSTLAVGKDCKQTSGSNEINNQFGKTFSSGGTTYYYKYDPASICKIDVKNLDFFELQSSYKNIFCAVQINLQPMYVSIDQQQRILQDVAVIRNLPIVLQQTQAKSPVFDFSLQGAVGGIKQHNHIPHIDGTGFAFAVFHPGTTMPQLSWSSV